MFLKKIINILLIFMISINLIGYPFQVFSSSIMNFTVTTNNNWGSWFCYWFTAENTGTEDITNWVIGINVDWWINNLWWGEVSSVWSNDYEITSNSTQNDSLTPWDSVNIGFCGWSPWNVTNIYLKSFTPVSWIILQDYSVSSNVLQVDVTTDSSWGSWYCRSVLLTNISNEIINDWQVNFELDQTLSSSSSANYVQNWINYTVTPLSWNQELAVWTSTTISFCTTGVNVDNSWTIGILSVWSNTWDVTPPVISSAYPTSELNLPNGNFNFSFEYSDESTWSGIDISSDIIELYQWDGYNWWTNISSTYVENSTKIITTTWAVYHSNNIPGWRYKMNFTISDLNLNLTSTWVLFNIATGSLDTSNPLISVSSHVNNKLYPSTDFDLALHYSDAWSGINSSTLDIELQKWNGISYGNDISGTYINVWTSSFGNSTAIYDVNKLWYWKYKFSYSIEDNDGNIWSGNTVLYIDEPKFTINKATLNLWNLVVGDNNFSSDTFIITVETLWAGFDVYVNKESSFLYNSVAITDWNGSQGFWYDNAPYTSKLQLLNIHQKIWWENGSINTNWDKNTYLYYVKFGAKIDEIQTAWEYNMNISFGIDLQYE